MVVVCFVVALLLVRKEGYIIVPFIQLHLFCPDLAYSLLGGGRKRLGRKKKNSYFSRSAIGWVHSTVDAKVQVCVGVFRENRFLR